MTGTNQGFFPPNYLIFSPGPHSTILIAGRESLSISYSLDRVTFFRVVGLALGHGQLTFNSPDH